MSGEMSGIYFRRGMIFSFEEFLHDCSGSDSPRADFSYVTGHSSPVGPHHYIKLTIVNDLAKSEEAILGDYNDTTRNYVHNVIRKDLCSYRFIDSPSESDLREYEAQAMVFARIMNIPVINPAYLRGLNRAKRLHLSYTYGKDGRTLSGHAHRLSAIRPELFFSFRPTDDNADKEMLKLLSKANRYNHYRDMLHYKSLGYEQYDFGGLSDGRSDNAKWNYIDEFKKYFGGTVREYYNSILYNTVKSKFYLKIRGSRI